MMKLKQFLTPVILISFMVTACETVSTPQPVEEIDTSYYFIFGNNMDTRAKFTYKDEYFTSPTTTFNKDLALMSFVATANSGQKKEMKRYYNELHFKNHYYTEVYDKGSGVNTYGFYMAEREIEDFTLIALSFRSYDYTLEWVSNVNLGESGNHAGFEYAVNNAIVEFNQVMNEKYVKDGKKIKLWVNGFSRGGAEANMFTTKILNSNEFGFTMDNVYCYTFEAPACFSEENVRKDYKNIWNCANSGDIVVNIPPSDYGLYRSGTDVDTLRSDFDTLYADYMRNEVYPNDPDKAQEYIDMIPEFSTSSKYKNEKEFMQELIHRILTTEDEHYGIQTRAQYVAHMQTAAMFSCELLYSLDTFALYYIINDFQNRYLDTPAHMLQLAGLLIQDDGKGLYDIAKAYLDFVEYEYNDDALRATCLTLYNVVTLIGFNDVVSIFNALPNIQRALYFHWHECTYVLVRAVEYNLEA